MQAKNKFGQIMEHNINVYMRSVLSLIILVFGLSSGLYAQNELHGLWARKIHYTNPNSGVIVKQVLNDSKGNTYIGGRFYGTVSLSGDMCNLINSGGYPYAESDYSGYTGSDGIVYDGTLEKSDGFVSKYDKNGNWVWSAVVQSNVWDQIEEMVLFNNEKQLAFATSAGNINYSSLTMSDRPQIIDGTGATQYISVWAPAPLPSAAFVNFVILDATNGKWIMDTEAVVNGVGYEHMKLFGISALNKQLILSTTRSHQSYTNHAWEINSYNELDGLMSLAYFYLGDGSGKNSAISHASKNSSNAGYSYYVISYDERGNGGMDLPQKWYTKIARVKSYNVEIISDLSYYYEANTTTYRQNYAKYGIINPKVDANSSDTHLFVTGHTLGSFTLQSNSQTITNSGGEDGIIVCYNPQNPATVRWMVNLRAAGNQNITDVRFDESTQTLKVVGYIDQNEVNFNPLGTAMPRKATNGTAVFYAGYDLNGICQYVEIMDADGDEKSVAFDLYGNNVSIAGTFTGSPFQADPAQRLRPLMTATPYGFLANYSTTSVSTPAMNRPGSLSAANNIKGSYGVAFHDPGTCLSLGMLNSAIDYPTALTYMPGNNPTGIANVNYDGLVNIQPNVPARGYRVNVRATNNKATTAYMMAWIDFNGNGIFDAHEASAVVTVNPNTVNQAYQLDWSTLPDITRAQLQTYMRIRLTTDLLDATWATGDVIDGEVEDYALTLDLLDVTKTAVSNNANPATADIDDIITYTITATNKIAGDFFVFDPIPAGTSYVSSTPSGILSNVTLNNGQTVSAILWPLSNVAVNTTSSFEVKVKVNSSPASGNILYNIGYAVMHGDTVPTTSANCYMGEITINSNVLDLQNDYIRLFACDEKYVRIIANDLIPDGSGVSIISPPQYGTATLGTDTVILYKNTGGTLADCCNSGGLNDSIGYSMCDPSKCDTAYVVVNILRCPDISLLDSCSVNPRLWLAYQYQDMKYDWEYSPDGTASSWTTILSNTASPGVNITDEGYYRVTIRYDDKTYQVKTGIKITIDKKITLPSGALWYNMLSQKVNITW